LKALVDQVAGESGLRRQVTLVVGARSRMEFYDSEDIDKLAASAPWLDVHYVLSSEQQQGEYPPVVQRALAAGDWRSRHVFVCGSDSMVSGSVSALQQAGYHPGQVHFEGFGDHWYGATWRAAVHGQAGEAHGGGQ
jgi:NAD(P)H-flavin reductase